MRRSIAILCTVILILFTFSAILLASEAVKRRVLILYDAYISFGDKQYDVFRSLLSDCA